MSQNDGVINIVFQDTQTGQCYMSWNNTDSTIVPVSRETCE